MKERISADVTIIGGGIVGASAALFLRRMGLSVVLLERDLCGSRASGVNYGGVRRQGRPLSQLPLSQRAHAIWAELPQLIGIDGEYLRSGHLKIARSEADLASLESYRELTRGFGMDLELLSARSIHERCPWLGHAAVGGSLCPEDGQANPRLVSPGFAARRSGWAPTCASGPGSTKQRTMAAASSCARATPWKCAAPICSIAPAPGPAASPRSSATTCRWTRAIRRWP